MVFPRFMISWEKMRNGNPVAPGEVTNDQLLEYQYPNDVVGMTIMVFTSNIEMSQL